jgi:superfamily II DNA or RNA helicase
MVSLTELRLRAARARIADVASVSTVPPALGSIRLQPHQQRAVSRVTQMIARHGGCLLAEDVGRGKTYVALAVARRWKRPLVVVPASLRTTWQRAMDRTRVPCAMVTHEALSRRLLPPFEPDGVIVDESHRFRSPDARRHAALAAITAHASVLLLSATPLQNGTRDLAAQLALFLGSVAFRSSETALARFVVRGTVPKAPSELPDVAPPAWLRTDHDDGAVLRAILSLPPPARSFDAGDAGVLRTIGLVRAWASSRAALVGALRRRTRVLTALEQCTASGLAPSRRDLRAWSAVDGGVQLVLAPLLVPRMESDGGRAMLGAVRAERAALDRLSLAIRASPDPDGARVAALRALRSRHPARRILAFSELATTVRAYFTALRGDAGVGMLTANEARIASGRVPRDALLDRFAPTARGASDPSPRECVTLLLATDLLSEGLNLQDASVVVHLDLPWNPARLAQRLGRVRRPGGAAMVHSYLMSPPAGTELLLQVDARLRTKLARAERTIGRALDVLPALATSPEDLAASSAATAADGALSSGSAELAGAVADQVAGWRRALPPQRSSRRTAPLVAAVACDESGWLLALDDGRLLARVGESGLHASASVARAVVLASGPARSPDAAEAEHALRQATTWLERESISLDCGVHDGLGASPLDVAIERRIARVLLRAPRHERARVLARAARLRDGLGSPRSLGAERELEALLASRAEHALDDVEWLERSLSVVERAPARERTRSGSPRVVALVLLGPSQADRRPASSVR